MKVFFSFLLCLALSSPLGDKEKLREAMGDNALAGTWVYDDLDSGMAEAGRTGKPLMVVLRCVP